MSRTQIPTTWEYSLQTEAENVIRCAHQMAINFYRINGFYVLPLSPSDGQYLTSDVRYPRGEGLPTVWMPGPRLDYLSIPRFWEKVKQVGYWDDVPENLLERMVELLAGSNYEQLVQIACLPCLPAGRPVGGLKLLVQNQWTRWEETQGEILQVIHAVLPDARGRINQIIIHPTLFGTTVKFHYPKYPSKKPFDLRLYLRADQDIYAITEAILTSLTRPKIYQNDDGLWAESEFLVDWLLTESAIAQALQKHAPQTKWTPTLSSTRRKQDGRVWEESEKFYREIGLGEGKELGFRIENLEEGQTDKGIIYFGRQKLRNLTPRETEILTLLIHNREVGASYDELADLIFENYDDFSLCAISKAIQRLRDKLESNGITGS